MSQLKYQMDCRNISCDKVQAIADYAHKQGYDEFAVAMESMIS